MKIGIMKPVEVDVRTVQVHVKVVDQGTYTFYDNNGEVVKELSETYVPSFFPEQHYGDYLILDINLETGVIQNWKKPTPEQLRELLSDKNEDD